MIVGVTTEAIAGEGLIVTAGGIDAHIHFICPQQAYEALASGRHHLRRRRHGPGDGHQRHHLHARRAPHRADAPGDRRPAASTSASRARATPRGPRASSIRSAPAPSASSSTRTGARRRRPSTAASRVAERRGRAGHHPHRHPQRVGLRRRLHRRVQGPHHPHLPLRGRRRRPRARHHPRLRRAQRAPELHQPHAPATP